MLFGNRKKQKKDDMVQTKKIVSAGELYLNYAEEYIKYMGKIRGIDNPTDDKEFYQKNAGPFYNSAMYFVNYLENTFSDELMASETPIDIDLNDMLQGADDKTKNLFLTPKYPGLIYLKDNRYSTHFHTDGSIIYEAEGVDILPGLSSILATDKINKAFNGLTPIEARALLQQMNIYPKNTELDQTITAVKERKVVTDSFLKSIICLLLLRTNKYSLKRARLFADSLGIYFNFEPFEKEENNILKKEM